VAEQEWFEKDYYKALGVSETAAHKDITRAYRKLARQFHPDTNPGNAAAEERFKEISAAYDVVGDETKRAEYDEVRKMGPIGPMGGMGGAPMGGFGGPGGYTFSSEDLGGMGGLGDILGGLFGRGRGQSARPSRGTGPQRGADLEAELHLPFRDAAKGISTTIHLTSDAACHTCHGSGAAPGTSPIVCPQCAGRGVVLDNQGGFSFSSPCPRCGGGGMIVENPCPTCSGTGVERRPREVKVNIPAGITNGKRIRLKGRGNPGRNGGPPGDLYVVCRVAADETFGIRGKDITIAVPITFAEAALGAKVSVPTIDGDTVTLRIPEGTAAGRTFRVKGRGVTTKAGTGDMLVTVEVAVPTSLTTEQRAAVEALAAASTESPRAHLGA
jgi:molecular chaperone DnaJ